MIILICFFGGIGVTIITLLIVGTISPKENHVELSQSFPIAPAKLWNFLRNVDLMTSGRTGVRNIEVLREHHGKIIEWMVHTTRGGFRVYRMEERPEVLTKILLSSTFDVTGRWDYHFETKPGGVRLVMEENSIIPSFFYRTYLLIRGRDLHLRREMKRIKDYVNSLSDSK